MHTLFESSDTLNKPFECFIFKPFCEQFPVRPHWHYFIEIIYMVEGEISLFVNGEEFTLTKGTMAICHPKTVHSIFYSDDPAAATPHKKVKYAVLKFDVNHLNVTPAYVPKMNLIMKSAEAQNMQIIFDEDFTKSINCEDLFMNCISESTKKEYGYDILLQANLYKLLFELVRYWQKRGFIIENDIIGIDNDYDIENIPQYIDSHIKDNIQVSELAQKCGMSYSFFAKKFKIHYGITCKEYLEKVQIFKIEDFLLFTDFDLNYISMETGFADCSHMIRCFKKQKGITPNKFRTLHKSQTQL